MLFDFSARFRYAVASKHWGASRGFALIMGFRSGSSALTVGRRTACCCGLQVCASSLGMYAPFCFLVSGRLWGWCLESFLGGFGPSPTLLAGPSLPKHSAWSARSGGCRSQGCHGYIQHYLKAPLLCSGDLSTPIYWRHHNTNCQMVTTTTLEALNFGVTVTG